ncbi:hypothetical protein Tco_1157235 [Tanacetum coccineum]
MDNGDAHPMNIDDESDDSVEEIGKPTQSEGVASKAIQNTTKADMLKMHGVESKRLRDELLSCPSRICLTSDAWTALKLREERGTLEWVLPIEEMREREMGGDGGTSERRRWWGERKEDEEKRREEERVEERDGEKKGRDGERGIGGER